MREYPSDVIPKGWYVIGWSDDFPVGKAVPLHYFDTDLVAYRGESGQLYLFDAYCPHMGAHLGHGGCIKGDSIACPYHGWEFGPDGMNTAIPYSETDKLNVGLSKWHIDEKEDVVMAYYSYDRSEPDVLPIQQINRIEGEVYLPGKSGRYTWEEVPMQPQFAAENQVDTAHFEFVHKAGKVASLAEDPKQTESCFSGRVDLTFGDDRGGVTWATPEGPVEGQIETETWGVGLLWSRLTAWDDLIYFLGLTPINSTTCHLRSMTWVAKTRKDGRQMDRTTRDLWVKQQNAQVNADLNIWRTQTYKKRVPFARSEIAPMGKFRKWAKTFYPTPEEAQKIQVGAQ